MKFTQKEVDLKNAQIHFGGFLITLGLGFPIYVAIAGLFSGDFWGVKWAILVAILFGASGSSLLWRAFK